MNKIEEKHGLTPTSVAAMTAKQHAKVTIDVACTFAEWVDYHQMSILSGGLWYSRSNNVTFDGFTSKMLFEEFKKTL